MTTALWNPTILNLEAEIVEAENQIRPYIRETPLDYSLPLSQQTGAEVYLKLENLQYTGSFKLRGALNKILSLFHEQRAKGIVAASTGNHGAAVAFALRQLKLPGIIFVPVEASPNKLEAIRRYGAEVRQHGTDSVQTEIHARAYAEERGMVYVSPYNDWQVVAGQGTVAVEIARQLDHVDAMFVSLGGGGLISGIATYLKSAQPRVKVIGCSPQNSPVMIESVKAGRIVEMKSEPTLSDATAGGIEPEAITFDLCRWLVDGSVIVSEQEIKDAMLMFIETHHLLIEGSAAVAVAAFLKNEKQFRRKNVVIVICGGNLSVATLKAIVS
jgi:threonine dehydratase